MFGIGAGIKLLSVFSSIKKLIKKYWMYIIPLLLILGAVLYHNSEVKKSFNRGQDHGIMLENTRVNKLIAKQDEINKKASDDLKKKISDLEVVANKKEKQRNLVEYRYKDNIVEIVKNNTIYKDCKLDNSIIDNINNIRKLGPKDEK